MRELPENWDQMSLGALWEKLNDPRRFLRPQRGPDAATEPVDFERLAPPRELTPSEAADPLSRFIARAAPLVSDPARPTKVRVRLLWAAAKAVRGLDAGDAVAAAFKTLAVDAKLIDARGRWVAPNIADYRRSYGGEDVDHVIAWALRGWNPFEEGPLE
jgi:hypothetical protein